MQMSARQHHSRAILPREGRHDQPRTPYHLTERLFNCRAGRRCEVADVLWAEQISLIRPSSAQIPHSRQLASHWLIRKGNQSRMRRDVKSNECAKSASQTRSHVFVCARRCVQFPHPDVPLQPRPRSPLAPTCERTRCRRRFPARAFRAVLAGVQNFIVGD
jgi:hypothetical protein